MTKSIEELIFSFENLKYASDIWVDSDTKDDFFEDDCFIHIKFGNLRFVFYNGQEDDVLTYKDIPKFKKQIQKLLED